MLTRLTFVAAALLLGACSQKEKSTVAPAPAVQLRTISPLGAFLTDGAGHTLYWHAREINADSAAAPAEWPAFAETVQRVGAGLRLEDFGTITTASGQRFTTYRGWPLHRYAPRQSGTPTPEPVGTAGGDNRDLHFAAAPAYGALIARQAVRDITANRPVTVTYLTDGTGRTLYTFGKDQTAPTTQATNCTGGCEAAWPVFVSTLPAVPAALRAADFGLLTRADGPGGASRQQLTYRGRPLYYYVGEANRRGAVLCHNVNEFGGLWVVAAP